MALNSSLAEGALAGDYRIVKKIAEGGMGEVFLVIDTAHSEEETCVLKSVLCGSHGDAKEALKEAKVLKDIRHPNIVQYLDVFPNQEAYKGIIAVCTVMEYCARGDLAIHLTEFKKRQGGGGEGLKEEVVVTWMTQLLRAVSYLHSVQVLHRDMKPHNVFITTHADLKIGDFGLATSLARKKVTSRVGTPSYIAPEVLQYDGYGEPVDLWGVGCLAYEMMTLDFLFERQGMLASGTHMHTHTHTHTRLQAHTHTHTHTLDVQRRRIKAEQLPLKYLAPLREMVAVMLLPDPATRPPAQQVSMHARCANERCMDGWMDGWMCMHRRFIQRRSSCACWGVRQCVVWPFRNNLPRGMRVATAASVLGDVRARADTALARASSVGHLADDLLPCRVLRRLRAQRLLVQRGLPRMPSMR